jgi:serine/threonine protein kinase/tetratricopeptide (TPR) repeat protein
VNVNHALRRIAEHLFQEVADLPPEKRSAFLEERCTTDPALRTKVEALLAGLEQGRIASLNAVEQMSEGEADVVGTSIGPYKLLELIGEGGLGAVYMAQQTEPVRRKVAVKIIKLGMDTKQVIARFEAERQALAMMDHPNVAKVFDAGTTETGRPYFAMELVRGNPITEYCDENGLPIRQRLGLFIQVCRAVQHAHQKGIIHRDIKPSNVMVTLHDGTPVVKIIDFGIVKATRGPLTDKTLFTRYHQFIGTPEYMSPEQAEISGLDIDTRSDIYSLGVLLYELLTGETPFDRKTLQNASLGDIQRIIREQDPVTPSRRVTALAADSKGAARTRQAETRTLGRLMRGDLDWIVMKALEKDRSRRYETAAALAEDVRLYLKSEPVSAGPPSRIYQFRKLVRRHRAAFGLAATLFGILAGFGLWMALLYTEAARLREQAEQERITAEANLSRARDAELKAKTEAQTATDVAEFLMRLFEVADPIVPGWDPAVARRLLDKGAQTAREELKNQPEMLATMLATIGRTYVHAGLGKSAEPLLKDALEIRRTQLGAGHSDTIDVMNTLAASYMDHGRLTEAETLLREAMELGRNAEDDIYPETLKSTALLAALFAAQGQFADAEPLGRRLLAVSRSTWGNAHPLTLELTLLRSRLLQIEGRWPEAENLTREALRTSLELFDDTDPHVIRSMILLGDILLEQGQLSEAEPLLLRAHETSRGISGDEGIQTVQCVFRLAELFRRQGRLDDAEAFCRRAWSRARWLVGDQDYLTLRSLANLGRVLLEQGRLAESEQILREALAKVRGKFGDRGLITLQCLTRLTEVLLEGAKGNEAETVLREYVATAGETLPSDSWQLASARSLLGACYAARGDYEDAELLLLESYPTLSRNLGEKQELTQQAIQRIVKLYIAWNRPEQASRWRARLAVDRG